VIQNRRGIRFVRGRTDPDHASSENAFIGQPTQMAQDGDIDFSFGHRLTWVVAGTSSPSIVVERGSDPKTVSDERRRAIDLQL
jgi:hypothetical protein